MLGREALEELGDEVLERRGAEICCLGDAWGLDCVTLELDEEFREDKELLELRELE